MTKKDYELIASEISYSLETERRIAREGNDTIVAQLALTMLAKNLAKTLSQENARFDTERFLKACNAIE